MPALNGNQMRLQIIATTAAIFATTSASALHFAPANANVKMAGNFNIIVDGSYTPCEMDVTVKTNQSGTSAKMTSFAVSNNCDIVAAGLPWKLKADSLSAATIEQFAYSEPDGLCGPIKLRTEVNGSGQWTARRKFKGPPHSCGITGSWLSTPPLTIVK
jgi:hypothetical protein